MKELQKCISLAVYEAVLTCGKTHGSDKLREMAVDKYYGGLPDGRGDTTIGYAEKMLKGQEMFSVLFNRGVNIPGCQGEHLVLRNDLIGRPNDNTKLVTSDKPGGGRIFLADQSGTSAMRQYEKDARCLLLLNILSTEITNYHQEKLLMIMFCS